MESSDFLPLNIPETRRVDWTTLKSKIVSNDLVLKKFHEKETECNQLKLLKRRLETDCTTYERELKQVLEELLPAKKALEEYKTRNNDQDNRIKELEDELKATTVITEQFKELAKNKEAETEEYKGLLSLKSDIKKKGKQLDRSKSQNTKLMTELKAAQRKLSNLKKSYTSCLKVLVQIEDKVGITGKLSKAETRQINTYRKILSYSKPHDAIETELNLLQSDNEDDNDIDNDDASKLEKLLQGDTSSRVDELLLSSDDEKTEKNIITTQPVKDKPFHKSPVKISPVKRKETMMAKKQSSQCLDHHSYSLLSLSPSKRRKVMSSPMKKMEQQPTMISPNSSPTIIKYPSPPPVILDNGICDSVTVGNTSHNDNDDNNTEHVLNLVPIDSVQDGISSDKNDLMVVTSGGDDDDDVLFAVDPNVPNIDVQMNFSVASLKVLAQCKLDEVRVFDDEIKEKVQDDKIQGVQVQDDKIQEVQVEDDKIEEVQVETQELVNDLREDKCDELQIDLHEDKHHERPIDLHEDERDELPIDLHEDECDELPIDLHEDKRDKLHEDECGDLKNGCDKVDGDNQLNLRETQIELKNIRNNVDKDNCERQDKVDGNDKSDENSLRRDVEVTEVVKYLITTACSNAQEHYELDVNYVKASSSTSVETGNHQLSSQNEKGQQLNVSESTDSVFIEESVTVNKVNKSDDEIKTTLRRVRRMTNRLSLSSIFERPLSPLPPSPSLSPTESFFDSMTTEENVINDQLNIVSPNEINELFGSDSDNDDEEMTSVPPRPFQHQESEGFDSELLSNTTVLDELRPLPNSGPVVERVKRSTDTNNSTKDKPSTLNTLPSTSNQRQLQLQQTQHCSKDSDSRYTNHSSQNEDQLDCIPSSSNPGNPSQTSGFNSKLKANFSHNSDTGNYSISIRLPDTNKAIKNLHFEIDTISNEFTLNFGPGSHQPLSSPPKNVSETKRKRVASPPFKDSCYDSTFDSSSSKHATLNSTPFSVRGSSRSDKKGSDEPTSDDQEVSHGNKTGQESKKGGKSSLLKSAAVPKNPPKFLPCNNNFINPRKPVDKPSGHKSSLLRGKTHPISPLTKTFVKARSVSTDSTVTSNPTNQIEEPSFVHPNTIRHDDIVSEPRNLTKPQSKLVKSSTTSLLEPEIPISQVPTLVNKRISHLNSSKNANATPMLMTKKVGTIIPQTKVTTLKRKLNSEPSSVPNSKKQCLREELNDEMKLTGQFWNIFQTPLVKCKYVEDILNDLKRVDKIEDEDTKEKTVQGVLNKFKNPAIITSSWSLISAIIFSSINLRLNPFTGCHKAVFPTGYENSLVAILFHLQQKIDTFKNLINEFKECSNSYLFKAHNKYINGLGEITRILTLICRQDEDIHFPRMLCFNMLKDRPSIAVFITGNVAISWPQVLTPVEETDLTMTTFMKIIMTQWNSQSGKMKRKAGMAIMSCFKVNKENQCDVTGIMKDLVHVYLEPNATDDELAGANLGLELLASYKKWDWTIRYLVKRQLLPILEQSDVRVKSRTYLVQLLGLLIKNNNPKNGELFGVMKALFKILSEEKVGGDLRDVTLFTLLHLHNYLDKGQTQNLKQFIANNRQTLSPKFLINKISSL